MESMTGVGMWFGSTNDTVTIRFSDNMRDPLINTASHNNKRLWNQSDGYITWDGGANKSIRLTYESPSDLSSGELVYWRGREFRGPVYITNGRNITIKNCIIEDGINQVRSRAYLLPGYYYSRNMIVYVNDYSDFFSLDAHSTYSAGIIERMRQPQQLVENEYHLDTIYCHHNVFSGNEISGFTYGIVSIGLNYLLAGVNAPHLIDVRDTIQNMSYYDLDKNADLLFDTMFSVKFGDGTASVRVYRQKSVTTLRNYTYYKHYTVYTNNVVTNMYTTIVVHLLVV